MPFCSKCGHEVSGSALFCAKCGAPVEQADPVPELSPEESIDYIHKLRDKLAKIEKLEQEVAGNEARLAKPLELNYRSYSFFRFFWPYLVGSLCTLYFFGLIFAMTSDNGRANFVSFLFVSVPVFIFILGIVLAGKRKNRENEAISLGNEKIKEQREKLEKETQELRSRLSTSRADLTAYNRYVPKKLCTTASMAKLKALIQSGKASSLQEAIRMLE